MQVNPGVLYALGSFVLWGLFPIYWKALLGVPAPEILAHRVFWSMLFLACLVHAQKRWSEIASGVRSRTVLLSICCSSLLIGMNWFIYIWAVNAGFVLETSLGYFINPLLTVLLGTLLLREQLRSAQILSIAIAAAGVLYMTTHYGNVPWISLVLATSFGLYGFVRKVAGIAALSGLALETAILSVPAGAYLIWLEYSGTGHFFVSGPRIAFLLAFSGVVTAMPLLWYTEAARRMRLSTLGVMQYVSPTGQFLLAVFLYLEPFTHVHLVTFVAIWSALAIFTLEGLHSMRSAVTRLDARQEA